MRAEPLVSCVVPTHNRPDLLAGALASIAAQTRRPDEVLVADDIGDPRVAEVVAACAAGTGLAVRHLPCPPATGASRSRNRGAAEACGEVLAFLDDDDRWAPGYLATALVALGHEDVEAVVTWTRFVRGGHSAPGRSVPPGLRAGDVVAANPGVTGSNLVLARSAWRRVGGFDEDLPVANDQDLFLRLLDAGVTYAVVPLRLVDKHLHDGPRIASPSPARKEGLARFAAKHAARQTPRDRRHLRAELVREAVRSASPVRRLLAGLHLLLLLGPFELRRWRRESARRALVPGRRRGAPAGGLVRSSRRSSRPRSRHVRGRSPRTGRRPPR